MFCKTGRGNIGGTPSKENEVEKRSGHYNTRERVKVRNAESLSQERLAIKMSRRQDRQERMND